MRQLFVMTTLAVLLGACGSGNNGSPWSPGGNPRGADPVSAVLQFPDVPVPNGFSLDSSVSFSKQKSGRRFGKLVYNGKMDLNELESFMIDQLEFQQWKLQSKNLREGVRALYFTKGAEEIELYIIASGWSVRMEIILG